MGFFDKMKGTASQAVSPGSQMAERDKIMRINQAGVDAQATIVSMQELSQQFGGVEVEFVLTVEAADGSTYPVTTRQSMHEGALNGMQAGSRVTVKVDPQDPQSLLVWGGAA